MCKHSKPDLNETGFNLMSTFINQHVNKVGVYCVKGYANHSETTVEQEMIDTIIAKGAQKLSDITLFTTNATQLK